VQFEAFDILAKLADQPSALYLRRSSLVFMHVMIVTNIICAMHDLIMDDIDNVVAAAFPIVLDFSLCRQRYKECMLHLC
jgi:hypothetical protein